MGMAAELKFGCVVRGSENFTSEQRAVYPPGICAETVGSVGAFLGKVTIPPGSRTRAHLHEAHESAAACRAARKSKGSLAIGLKIARLSALVTIGSGCAWRT